MPVQEIELQVIFLYGNQNWTLLERSAASLSPAHQPNQLCWLAECPGAINGQLVISSEQSMILVKLEGDCCLGMSINIFVTVGALGLASDLSSLSLALACFEGHGGAISRQDISTSRPASIHPVTLTQHIHRAKRRSALKHDEFPDQDRLGRHLPLGEHQHRASAARSTTLTDPVTPPVLRREEAPGARYRDVQTRHPRWRQ